jgi:hypothetical protein
MLPVFSRIPGSFFPFSAPQIPVFRNSASANPQADRLAGVPTPAGPSPRQIGAPAQATLLPVIEVSKKPR